MSEFIGAQSFFNDAVTTPITIKTDAGALHALRLVNTTAQPAYLQIFDLVAGSVTLGTTPAKWTIRLAGSESMTLPLPKPVLIGKMSGSNAGISVAGTTTAGGSSPAAISVSAAYE